MIPFFSNCSKPRTCISLFIYHFYKIRPISYLQSHKHGKTLPGAGEWVTMERKLPLGVLWVICGVYPRFLQVNTTEGIQLGYIIFFCESIYFELTLRTFSLFMPLG